MSAPLLDGRKLPANDFEGDDFTPGAGGAFVTCQDTASGRMVAYATNGRVDVDGKTYRANLGVPDSNGISFQQVAVAVHRVAGKTLVIPGATPGVGRFGRAAVVAWLTARKGLVVDGYYGSIDRAYRSQAGADFNHAIWFSHISPTSGARMWDPLNPDIHGYGRWVPVAVLLAFAASLDYLVAYVELEPLPVAPKPDPSVVHVTV